MDQMHPREALCFKEATTQKKKNRVNSTSKYTNMELLDYMEDLLMLTYQKMQSSQFFYQDKNISQNC